MTSADIIQAAFKAWGRELYRNTSLSQVSRELGVSKPALYRHFRNKQALLDAMYESFFDDYAAFIRPYHEKAFNTASYHESLCAITQAMMKYYAKNGYAFLFSLINVWGNSRVRNMKEPLLKRGVDMGFFSRPAGKWEGRGGGAPLWLFAVATLVLAMAHFHRRACMTGEAPPDALVDQVTASVSRVVSGGLNFDRAALEDIDYEELESGVARAIHQVEEDPLLRGVAEAVARAGPWNASMEMVARHSGLSKSGLYAHFKSKEEMMARLFFTEFNRIGDFALKNQRDSAKPGERLYLGVFSIAVYFRSRPNILLAMDWLRTRRIDPKKFDLPRQESPVFQDFRFPADYGILPGDDGFWISQWIFFLVLTVLTQGGFKESGSLFSQWKPDARAFPQENLARIPNESFRDLYRFIASGVKGFCT
ncbi:MAG: TetR/AcrR family transcriptional regulator [Treponema sp.]|jgi:AcrR family transcriptional regulator|nr:TetR/AcrR family transcriptional regulator [Treponema sp.]